MNKLATTISACAALLCLLPANLLPALEPQEIAIIVNSRSQDSQTLADYYCRRRRVPTNHIIALPMPQQEIIPRNVYQNDIAPKIRQRLLQSDLHQNIKCLLTLRGVPLTILPYTPTGPTSQKRDLIIQQLDNRFAQVQHLTAHYAKLAGFSPPTTNNSATPFALPRDPFKRATHVRTILTQAQQTAQKAQAAARNLAAPASTRSYRLEQLQKLNQQWLGLRHTYANLAQTYKTSSDDQQKQYLQPQLTKIKTQIETIANQIKQTQHQQLSTEQQLQRYELIYQLAGLRVLCHTLLADRTAIDDELSKSAFDSELSLILWDHYPLSRYQTNTLRAHPPAPGEPNTPPASDQPTLMVARLDGPSLQIAKRLIDKALAAEQTVLRGDACFDARGLHQQNPPFGSFPFFDQSLRDAARLVQSNTALNIILDNNEKLFPPGRCPKTTLYCGWYSLKNYVDAFDFNIGAVGYHIASFEAQTLRDPESNVWCKRLLEEGITATLGAVHEPFLHAIPRPDLFFADLTSERFSLVECFYRTKPFNSWMLTLIGDPLYQPRYAKQRGFQTTF